MHSSSCRIFNDEWFKKCPELSNAMGVRMEGKCFIERGREKGLETVPKKKAFCPYWCQFLQSTKTTVKQLNYRAYVPVNGQQYRIIKYKKHKYTMAYQEYEWYEKGNIDVGRFKRKIPQYVTMTI